MDSTNPMSLESLGNPCVIPDINGDGQITAHDIALAAMSGFCTALIVT